MLPKVPQTFGGRVRFKTQVLSSQSSTLSCLTLGCHELQHHNLHFTQVTHFNSAPLQTPSLYCQHCFM